MNKLLRDVKLINKYSQEMGGVFSTGDLHRLFGQDTPVLLYRRIRTLEGAGILTRFSRGFYVTTDFNREALCGRVNTNSYISFGTILAKELMIGSTPTTTVYAVKTGKNREYQGAGLTIVYMGISQNLFFGYDVKNGVRLATAEKALLDTLFFYQQGYSFSFNIYEDIDTTQLDQDIIFNWLKYYRNPRFISFVKGYLSDRS